MIVVSDTSPLLSLARIDRLDLLHGLYQQVLIPPGVFDEIRAGLAGAPSLPAIEQVSWVVVARPQDVSHVQALRGQLDLGEAEAIVLAIERRADVLLVDERRGRRTASAAGLAVTGLLGVIAEAKHRGLVDEAKPLIDALIDTARFWIGRKLYDDVLTQLGER